MRIITEEDIVEHLLSIFQRDNSIEQGYKIIKE